jgi:oxygen-dependent protoporphyrinogen oxidase
MPKKVQALVIGAGISGLAAAYYLQKANVDTLVVDSAQRPGGVIHSIARDGYLVECGPQSFSGSPGLTALFAELNLLTDRVLANPKAPRYILIDGVLQPVPVTPPALLASPLLGGGARFALLRDLLGRSQPPDPDESIAQFVRRKFSATLLERLVGPLVSGIYAGDPEKLSLRAAFPAVYEAESKSGSVLRGMFRKRKKTNSNNANEKNAMGKHENPTVQSLLSGNEQFTLALAATLGERLLLNKEAVSVAALAASNEPQAARFRVTLRGLKGTEIVECERLLLAVPANIAAQLIGAFDAAFFDSLDSVEYAGVAVVSLGYPNEAIGRDANGFGFLVPRSSGLSVLGTVWNSSLFPGRAPAGYSQFTSFVGGATNPAALQQSPEALAARMHREITPILQLRQNFVFSDVTIWPRAIPQYNLGHTARIQKIQALLTNFPGLHLLGNYLHGPAIPVCIQQAQDLAAEIRISFAN